jgi:transposase InsO family protein
MSCDVCQKLNKGGHVNKSPIMTPPIIDEPFKRLSIDVVTSLPLTETGNRVIIVIVDHGTRWAECYARPNHTAKTVAKCVADYMTHYGVAKKILHDLGADFTSELLQVFLNYFGVDPLQCSIAHPQTNTAVERTNGTIKNMLRTFIAQHTEYLGRGPMLVCFAYRELPVAELGFSPV